MSESAKRRLDMLKSALGSITPWLEKDTITEIMLNPDGKVWVNEQGLGMYKTGIVLNSEAANRIIRLIIWVRKWLRSGVGGAQRLERFHLCEGRARTRGGGPLQQFLLLLSKHVLEPI